MVFVVQSIVEKNGGFVMYSWWGANGVKIKEPRDRYEVHGGKGVARYGVRLLC